MAEQIVIDLSVNAEKGNQGVGTLRQQLKLAVTDAQAMAEQFGETSKQAIEAAKKAANLKEQIADINDTINALSPEAKFNAVIGVAQGIAGGFAAAQGAMALFGAESENVQKALLKVQAAMAIAQGLNDIKGLSDSFKNLGIVIRSSTVYVKLAALAQVAYNSVVGASTGAMKLFRLALASTGIGALVVALGSAVVYWKELNAWVEKNSVTVIKWGKIILGALSPPIAIINLLSKGVEFLATRFDFVKAATEKVSAQFEWLGAKIRELLEEVGLLDTKEEAAAEKRQEQSKIREQQIQRQIALAKAQGASEEELAALEVSLAREKFLAYDQYIKARKAAGREVTEEEQSNYEELAQGLKIAKLEEIKAQENANKKLQEEREKAFKKIQEENKKRKEEEERLQRELQDAKIANIANEQEREVAQLNLSFQRKLEAIKGNSAVEIALRKEIETQHQTQLAELNNGFAIAEAERKAEELQAKFASEDALLNARLEEAKIKNQNEELIRREQAALKLEQDLVEAGENANLKLAAEINYNNALTEIERAAEEERLESQRQVRDAKLTLAQNTMGALTAISETFIRSGKKQEAVQKALAITQLGIDTAKSISATIAGASAAAAAGGPAAPFLLAGYITSGIATILTAFASAKKTLGGAGGGGSTPSLSGTGGGGNNNAPDTRVPRPSDVEGLNRGQAVTQAMEFNIKANVIESDMTDTQKKISDIKERATF
jgi:hypothetical protein